MTEIRLNSKQKQAWDALHDDTTREVVYGGAASGGKSFLLCLWIMISALKNPGTAWLIGRNELINLRRTTLVTLQEVARTCSVEIKSNSQLGCVDLPNGSRIWLKALSPRPGRDPNYQSLGSLEIAGAAVDEFTEIEQLAWNTLQTRIRKGYTTKVPKILGTCNPEKCWVKDRFYDPYVKEALPEDVKFIQATAHDNPHVPEEYIETLSRLDTVTRQRLLDGNWDYADAEDAVFSSVELDFVINRNPEGDRVVSIDVAHGVGSDKSVALFWVGDTIIDYIASNELDTAEFSSQVLDQIQRHRIKKAIVDCDGIGKSVYDNLRRHGVSCQRFLANAKDNTYANAKTAAFFKLKEQGIRFDSPKALGCRDALRRELAAIRWRRLKQGDGKISLAPKDDAKRRLGHSPDFADAAAMRAALKTSSILTSNITISS